MRMSPEKFLKGLYDVEPTIITKIRVKVGKRDEKEARGEEERS